MLTVGTLSARNNLPSRNDRNGAEQEGFAHFCNMAGSLYFSLQRNGPEEISPVLCKPEAE